MNYVDVIESLCTFESNLETAIKDSKGDSLKESQAVSILQILLLKAQALITLQHNNSECFELKEGKEIVEALEKFTLLHQDW